MTLLKAIPIRWAPRSRLGWSYAGPHPGSVIARREEFTAALLRFGATPAESAVAWDALAGLLSEVGRGPVFVALDPSGDRAATLRVVSLTPRLAWHIRTAQLPVELRLAGAAGPERAQHLAAFASMQLGCWLEKHAARIAALGVVAAHRDVPAGLAPVVRPGDVAYGLGVLGQALQNGVADLWLRDYRWSRSMLERRSYANGMLDATWAAIWSIVEARVPARLRPYVAPLAAGCARSVDAGEGEESFISTPEAAAFFSALSSASGPRSALAALRANGLSQQRLYLECLTPVQRESGRLWELGQMSVAEEHRRTAIVRTLISDGALPALTAPTQGSLVLLRAPTEQHDIGLKMIAHLARLEGWDVALLERALSEDEIVAAVCDRRPDVVAFSASLTSSVARLVPLIARLKCDPLLEDIAILAGGAPFIAFPQLAGIIGADGTAPDAEAALELLQRLRASKGSAAVARAPTPESLNASKLESIVQAGSWTMEHATGQCTWSGGLYALLDIAPAHSPPSYELLSSVVHPDDRRNVAAAWREAHVERAPFELIHRLRLPNGLTKIVLQRAQTSYDVAGSPVQTVGMLVDITREQLTRRKLDAATAKLMAVWEHVPEGLALIDAATGELIEVNPQAEHLLGADQAALAGVHYTKLFPPKRRRAARAAFAAGLSTPARNVESILRNHVPVEISTSGGFRVGAAEMTLASFRDITRRKLLERSTERFAATMAAMVRANAAIVRAASAEELLRLVCESIVGDRYVGALIAEPLHEPRGSARVLATAGPARYFEGLEIGWDVRERSGRGPFGEATRLGRPVTALVSGRDFAPWRKRALACGIGAAIALPIPETAGSPVFVIYAGDAHGFTPGEIALFESLASDIGLGLRALRRSAEVESALGGALAAVVATLEQRDPYTAGHEERVRELCGLIGTELGLESERLRGLCLAASVHDLGKISIPTEILTKPTRLSEVEFAFVRQHPFTGYNILRNIPFRWNVADIVLQHHEYLDGSGYPNGLRGDEILLEARILTVADIVDSMSAFRPYHRPFDLETVMAELTRLASTRLDPRVVEACVRILRSGAFKPALSGICR